MKKPWRILVIDDEASFTRLVKLNLEDTGAYEVLEENNERQALATARALRPDLILLDIIMPDFAGGEIATKIRSDRALTRIPIVFLTAMASREQLQKEGGIINGYQYLAKPISMDELQAAIERYLHAGMTEVARRHRAHSKKQSTQRS